MKHETKLGIAFIGILLTIFGVLVMKKLSRTGNATFALSQSPANTPAEPKPTKLASQPAPPTLVTPKAESSKAPESSLAATPLGRTASAPLSATPSDRAPTLLATPSPATDLGDRYAANNPRDPYNAAANTPAAQPYRSGYPTTNEANIESKPSAPATEIAKTPLEPNPPVRETIEPRHNNASRYGETTDNNLQRYGNAHNSQPLAPTAPEANTTSNLNPYKTQNSLSNDHGSPTPAADRYAAAPRTQDVYPIATTETAPTAQRIPTTNPVASTGAIVPASGIERNGDQYTVQANDSFWTVCQKAYGNGAFFKALYEHNRKKHPEVDEMKVGQVISVPDESVLRRAYPDLCPKPQRQLPGTQQRLASASARMRGTGRVYTVEEGDTLFEIARHELGKPARWSQIYDLNRDVLGSDFDYLRPGLELILPDEKPHTENMTRQPEGIYSR